jgi:hypothetical protein
MMTNLSAYIMTNMLYLAKELKAKLKYLTLTGQNADGELEFIGSTEDWLKANEEETMGIDYINGFDEGVGPRQ